MNNGEIVLNVRTPEKPFLLSALVCSSLWLVAPIDFQFEGDAYSLILGVLLPVCLVIGLRLGFGKKGAALKYSVDMNKLRRATQLLVILGGLGLVLRLYERIFVRGGGALSANILTNRELIESGGSGSLALIGGVLTTLLLFVPVCVLLLKLLGERKRRYSFIFLLSLAYPISDVLLQGSRSSFVMYVGVLYASFSLLGCLNFRSVKFFLVFVVGLILIWFSAQVFAERTAAYGIDPLVSMTDSGYAYFAPIEASVGLFLYEEGLAGVGGIVFAFGHFCQYVLHGIYEFFYLSANVPNATTFGLQSFYIPSKFVLSVLGEGKIESIIMEGMLRPGVYTTLFGPLIYDFGIVGSVFASLILGYGAGLSGRLVKMGRTRFLPIYLVVLGFLPFAFVVNLFTSGAGQYLLISSLILVGFFPKCRFYFWRRVF
mgnify:CR=1 FL=1